MTDFSSIPIRRNGQRFDASWWNTIRDALIDSGTVPTITNYASDAEYEAAKGSAGTEGDFYYNTTTDFLKFHNGTAWVTVADDQTAQTFTNKIIDANSNTISNLEHGAEVDNPTSGVHGVVGDIVGTTDAQAITEKDIDGGTASDTSRITLPKNTTTNLDGLTDKEATLAYDTDKATVVVNDGADWVTIAGGGGQGGINYITNYNAEDGLDDWTNTGGLTFSLESTSPLFDTQSFKLTNSSGASQAGNTLETPFTVDAALKYNMLSGEFWVRNSDLDTGDFTVKIYDVDNSAYISLTEGEEIGAANYDKTHTFSFQATDSVNYKLEIYTVTTDTSVYEFIFDNVNVGPAKPAVIGAPVTDWEFYSFTPLGFGSVSSVDSYWRRVGDSIEIQVEFTSGTHTAVEARFPLPSGLSVSSIVASNNRVGDISTSYAADVNFNILANGGGNYLSMGRDDQASSGLANVNANAIGNSSEISFYAKVPIQGWSSGVTMSETVNNREISFIGYHSTNQNTTTGIYTAMGASGEITKTKDTVNMFNSSTGVITIPETGEYEASMLSNLGNSASGVRYYALQIMGTDYAIAGDPNPSGGNLSQRSGSRRFQLEKGYQVTFTAFQNSGSTLIYYASTSNTNYSLTKVNTGSQTIAASEKVYVHAYGNGGTTPAIDAPVPYTTIIEDSNGSWATTGVFTAPKAAWYQIEASARTSGAVTIVYSAFVNNVKADVMHANSGTSSIHKLSGLIKLDRGDTFHIGSNISTLLSNSLGVNFHVIRIHSL